MKKAVLAGALICFLLVLAGCGGTNNGGGGTSLKDGTYTGKGEGYKGPIEIEVVVSGGKITDMKVVSQSETEGVSDPAFEGIREQLIEKQTNEGIEAVSGATSTSRGLIEALDEAVPKAKQ